MSDRGWEGVTRVWSPIMSAVGWVGVTRMVSDHKGCERTGAGWVSRGSGPCSPTVFNHERQGLGRCHG